MSRDSNLLNYVNVIPNESKMSCDKLGRAKGTPIEKELRDG
jgi:hypothetical protein